MEESASLENMISAARSIRDVLRTDPHRPRYHLIPPEGFFNDPNGALFWKGRYHLFYLARTPIPEPSGGGRTRWVEVWDHASSADMLHWVFHGPAIRPATDGSTPRGIYSGGAVRGAPEPTLIYHVPGQGTCVAVSSDDELSTWSPLSENPVVPIPAEPTEYVVFDPCAWRETDGYYALIGNKNHRPGHDGDSTSIFRSPDLRSWEYLGPFYRSSREWTEEMEDCACPDFFPLGERHMLLMHGHRPYFQCHYYLGRYEGHRFHPEEHGRMNWPGGQLSAPETLLDDRGRRIMFGWIREARSDRGAAHWTQSGWASVVSLPRVLSLNSDGRLCVEPVEELKRLRTNHRRFRDLVLEPEELSHLASAGRHTALASGDCLEIAAQFDPGEATQVGLAVRCSPDFEEHTPIVVDLVREVLRVELGHASLDSAVSYPRRGRQDAEALPPGQRTVDAQEAPLRLHRRTPMELRVFLDRSVLEVFVNREQCLTQRIYPTRSDSLQVFPVSRGGRGRATQIDVWDMHPTAPW